MTLSTPSTEPVVPSIGKALARTTSQKGQQRGRFTSAQAAAWIGALLIATLLVTAIFAPVLAPFDPTERVARPFQAPNAIHILGTNDIGQDILSELIYGTRISLAVGTLAALISIVIGTTIGLVAGYFPRTGNVLMR